jgi:elongation factor 1-beta
MGEVAATLRIMPDSADRDLKKLQADLTAALPKGATLRGFQEKPIAFGLKALMCTVIVGDDIGGTEAVEEAFNKIEGVASINMEEMGRL